jgi:uncharacterized protein with ParB-like and HNH nuclease domain
MRKVRVFNEIQMTTENEPLREEMPVTNNILSYNVSNTVEILIQKITNDEINLKPEFQRDFVWDINRASLFIDSLIIGLPIPNIFLAKTNADESFKVIDGQQRLKTIYYFFKEKFKSNGKERIFKLKNLENRDWNDKSFSELNLVDQRRFKNAVLGTTIIEHISSEGKTINDIFYRLNTSGMPLNDQEIRNCVYSGNFNEFLKTINLNKDWRSLLGNETPDKRFKDVELILRFFALYYNFGNYNKPMRDFLSDYMDFNRTIESEKGKLKNNFEGTVQIIAQKIGGSAFRQNKLINKALCDSVMVSIAKLLSEKRLSLNPKKMHHKLLKNKKFKTCITDHTTDEDNLKRRMKIAIKYFTR